MAELLLPLESLSLEDPSVSVFERRNDIHVYITNELVFGALNYEYFHFYFSSISSRTRFPQ